MGVSTQKKQCLVAITNNTRNTIRSVSVVHKYSDVHSTTLNWENLQDTFTSTYEMVFFNTGLLTTGRDWWFISWVNDKGETWISSPKNNRAFIDVLESASCLALGVINGLAIKTAISDPEILSKTAASAIFVTSGIAAAMLNNASTASYKQHILRQEDAEIGTRIVLNLDSVEFLSQSGKSTTGVEMVAKLPVVK